MKGRIQVVMCRLCSTGGGVLDVDALLRIASDAPNVGAAVVVDRLCDKATVASLAAQAKDKEVDRVLLLTCPKNEVSPFVYQTFVKKARINEFLIDSIDLNNEVVLPHRDDAQGAQAKAEGRLLSSISRMARLQPLERKTDEMRTKNVVVIGAGISGLEAAGQAAQRGLHTVILEKTGREVKAPGVVMPESKVVSMKGEAGNYVLTIEAGQKRENLECAAIVVATGGDWSDARGPLADKCRDAKPLYRLRQAVDEDRVPTGTVVIVDTPDPKGTRTKVQDYAWDEALDCAMDIKRKSPSTEVYLVFQEMRVSGMREIAYKEAADLAVRFIRYDRKNPPRLTAKDSGRLELTDLAQGEAVALPFDVLAYASIAANPDNVAIANALRIPLSPDGGVRRGSMQRGPVATPRPGIFVCGSAMFPKSESAARAEGRAAGIMAAQYAGAGKTEYGGSVAETDAEKCSACLTCVRTCPYEAPFIGAAGKAEIRLQMCQGCGMCVGICPSKAIDLHHYTDEQIAAETTTYLRGDF
ncbi:MAG: CoB--CoM heterodisulfide reductase iron-sulfur subunit A family protein [Methanobacteriota archaeon]|nr:MAG: CoB--CoM heterodisulfide reductase iron-sulfur subunit A family protein [Euryarchaeota archaeon]